MRVLVVAGLCVALGGCVSDGNNNIADNIVQSSVFAQPTVVYHSGDNIEISYYVGGIQQSFNEKNAIELLKKECGGAFRITNRTSTGGNSFIDAVCVR
jgi:hypothetical protein